MGQYIIYNVIAKIHQFFRELTLNFLPMLNHSKAVFQCSLWHFWSIFGSGLIYTRSRGNAWWRHPCSHWTWTLPLQVCVRGVTASVFNLTVNICIWSQRFTWMGGGCGPCNWRTGWQIQVVWGWVRRWRGWPARGWSPWPKWWWPYYAPRHHYIHINPSRGWLSVPHITIGGIPGKGYGTGSMGYCPSSILTCAGWHPWGRATMPWFRHCPRSCRVVIF